MISVDRVDVLDAGIQLLNAFQARTGARGRFVALYLGLRKMGNRVAPLGSNTFTPVSEIESYLDFMWTKRHRSEPVNVLTAPFGGSTGANAGYSTVTGTLAPGNRYATNTWRNNLNIQKGVGCAADPATILELLRSPGMRMSCPHMRISDEAGHVCGITGTSYRGEEHAIWLASGPTGYQVADLDEPAVYSDYLKPSGQRIPIFPLLAVLYVMAPAGFYPSRSEVSIPDFAADFGFELGAVEELFDCDPDSLMNSGLVGLANQPFDAADATNEIESFLPALNEDLPELGEAIALNNGLGAEIAVASELKAQGWAVYYTGNQQLIGYDLRAERDGAVLHVEVKSSVGFTTPELTESEWKAAKNYADTFVLAIVDFVSSDKQSVWYVRDPADSIEPTVKVSAAYRLARTSIEFLRTEADFL